MRVPSLFAPVDMGSRSIVDWERELGSKHGAVRTIRAGETFYRFDVAALRRLIGTGSPRDGGMTVKKYLAEQMEQRSRRNPRRFR